MALNAKVIKINRHLGLSGCPKQMVRIYRGSVSR